jgi:uncharacterized protein YgbK (DUF1537 family)
MTHTAVIADDLTGANDTACQFARYGMRTCVLLNPGAYQDLANFVDVAVLDTETRALSAAEAYHRARTAAQIVRSMGPVRIYKKIDSTLRGNLGAEIQAIADVTRPALAVIAPAFPRYKRTTLSGSQFVNSELVSLTETARDPKAPVLQPYIPGLLRTQTSTPVGLVPLAAVRQGKAAILGVIDSLLARGEHWLVFDAATDEDLRQIAGAAADYADVLWVGSTGLARVLPEALRLPPQPKRHWHSHAKGTVLVIAGSVSQTTRNQIKALLREPGVQLVSIDVVGALRDPVRESQRCIDRAHLCSEMKPPAIIVASAFEIAAREAAMAEGANLGLAGADVSTRIAQTLGLTTAGLAAQEWAGFVLTGGDTAFEVCRALGIEIIEVFGELAPGIPIGAGTSDRGGNLWVVTKAGGFGDMSALVKIVRVVRGEKAGS